MRTHAPFQQDDLAELDELLDRALAVVTMRAIAKGVKSRLVVGLRHDVDNRVEPAVAMAEWEAERGYHSTYYVLHTAPYWHDEFLLRRSLERIAELGHEVGIHSNAVVQSFLTGLEPGFILSAAIAQLRSYGFDIRGSVAHGDPLCYGDDGKVRFVNDELFSECARPSMGEPDRLIGSVRMQPRPLAEFGLDYDANWLPRGNYLSDSGGRWSQPFEDVAEGFPFRGQLHMLIHPDWWPEALSVREVAA